MIPGSFDYHRPASLPDAVKLLAGFGDTALVLAGGHSLIPMMKLRMAAPEHLVDVSDVADLKGIEDTGDTLIVGAMTTQHELIESETVAQRVPLLREASLQIADPQVRYVGTIGGNVANGDPGNDLPAVMQCLDATFELASADGERTVSARSFYNSAFETERGEAEILVRVRIPLPAAGTGSAYLKQKRKIGDYATAAAAVTVRLEGGSCVAASIALTNLSDTPVYAADAAASLVGGPIDDVRIEAALAAAQAVIDPSDDNRGPVAFKRHVTSVLLKQAILTAAERAV